VPASADILIDVTALAREHYARTPDAADPAQRVRFATSGHRGSSLDGAFNEAHVLAITQAICNYRQHRHLTGPLYGGRDTHAVRACLQDGAGGARGQRRRDDDRQ
jgi:phosphoglucomutase